MSAHREEEGGKPLNLLSTAEKEAATPSDTFLKTTLWNRMADRTGQWLSSQG